MALARGSGNIKGTGVVGIIKYLRKHKALAEKLVPPSLGHYLRERIIVSSWYPEREYVELLRALARVTVASGAAGITATNVWEVMGAQAARADLAGVYRALLRPGDPAATMLKTDTIWRTYHDSGEVKVSVLGACRVRTELSGYVLAERDVCAMNSGFFAQVVRSAGGRDPEVKKVECRARAQPSCVWEISWRPPVSPPPSPASSPGG